MADRQMSETPITFRLRPAVARQVKDLADAEGNTTSAVARRLLALGLAQVHATSEPSTLATA
jgi:predicted transcriptional regulator